MAPDHSSLSLKLIFEKKKMSIIIICHFPLNRNDKGFQHVKNPSNGRSILVYEAVGTRAVVYATQPSDCKLLHRDHIQCASIEHLSVSFNRPFMHNINGPAPPETLEDWQGAIQHLLSTYQPRGVSMYFGDVRPGMQQEFTLDVKDGETYRGLLGRNKDILHLFR